MMKRASAILMILFGTAVVIRRFFFHDPTGHPPAYEAGQTLGALIGATIAAGGVYRLFKLRKDDERR